MSALVRRLPGDPLLYGRVFGLLAGAVWMGMGSLIVAPIAVLALTVLFGTIVYSWTAQSARGRPFTLTTAPIGLVLTDLGAASLWVVATAYRDEQERATRALRRASLLEEAAADIAAETGAESVLASIPRHALELVQADHATLNVHRGSEFLIVAGAGIGERVIGVHAPATTGIVGRVVLERATVTIDDYRRLLDAPKAVLALGLRSAIAVPVLVQGEIGAVLNVARRAVR